MNLYFLLLSLTTGLTVSFRSHSTRAFCFNWLAMSVERPSLKRFREDVQTLYLVIVSVIIVPKLLVQNTIADSKLQILIYLKVMRHCDTKAKLLCFSIWTSGHVIRPNVPIRLPAIECKSHGHFFKVRQICHTNNPADNKVSADNVLQVNILAVHPLHETVCWFWRMNKAWK